MILPYLIEKEFKQMMRSIVQPVVFVLLPLLMINALPRLATQEIKNLRFCIVDNDRSPLSERLTAKIAASEYFNLTAAEFNHRDAMGNIDTGNADLIIEIGPDFEKHLVTEGVADVSVLANAVDGIKAGLGSSYASQIIADFAADLRAENGTAPMADISKTVSERYMYNATLDYKTFMIPGIMGMLLLLLVGFLPALNIVGEKEKGTIEQINVTPVGKFDFILSKLIPYWIVGFVIFAYAMLLAYKIHGLAPVGDIGVIFLFVSLFILVVSSLGLVVSNYSSTMQQASLVMFFFLVIFILLSGLLTPVQSMPEWAQRITLLNPLRYLMETMRALYLKGSTLSDLIPQLRAFCVFIVVFWTWAIVSYKKNG